MDATQKLLARKLFRLRVHEAQATDYQRLFEKVMSYRFQEFVPIKPHGNVGDRKNDGYIPPTATYFQVHAPEDPTSPRAVAIAAEKAKNDFEGLLEHWSPVRAYRFVFNDRYRGCPAPVEAALAAIRKDHELDARVFLAKDLEEEVLELADDQLFDVIQTILPEPGPFASVDFGILNEVVEYILKTRLPVTPESLLKAPDFEEKIQFNGLTPRVAGLLTVGSYQSEAVSDFFAKNSEFARQKLRDHLATMYGESTSRIGKLVSDPEDRGDLIFFDLREAMTPPTNDDTKKAMLQEAIVVVMAFYFEACDIFEDPQDAPA